MDESKVIDKYSNDIRLALLEQSMDEFKNTIKEINNRISDLPNEIIKRMNETIDLKIQTKVQSLENKQNKQTIGFTISIIVCLISVITSVIIALWRK